MFEVTVRSAVMEDMGAVVTIANHNIRCSNCIMKEREESMEE